MSRSSFWYTIIMSSDWTLVTGANGFLGARLVRRLVERGEKVKALVRAGANLRELEDLPPEQVRIAVGDVRMMDRVYAALSSCSTMYHVAATYSIDENRRKEIMADSLEGTKAVLEAARRADVQKIVVTSSVAALGTTSEPEPMEEDAQFNLQDCNAYSAAKYAADQYTLERAAAGQPIVIVNPGAIVGPGDWKPTPTGSQIVEYLGHSPSFSMPYMPGGFSYADVDDVADGHILAMQKGRVGERYLLGGENLSVKDLYTLLSDVTGLAEPGKELSRGTIGRFAWGAELFGAWTGRPPVITRKAINDFYGAYSFVNSDKAKKELGYDPRSARQAIARSCRWYLDNDYVSKRAARRARLELHPA